MPLKPSSIEDEYFAREEAIKLRKLTNLKRKELSAAEQQKLKELHFMHCPKCGMDMKTIKINDVDIDKCFACGGLFFDDGELEKVTRRASEFFKSVDSVFKE
jgi:uncharacterized protein